MVSRLCLGALLFLSIVIVAPAPEAQSACNPQQLTCSPSGPGFLIAAYNGTIVKDGGKCLDYTSETAGAPVFLSDCAVAHPFRVVEVRNAQNAVIPNQVYLVAGQLVLGVKVPRPAMAPDAPSGTGGTLAAGYSALELQPLSASPRRFSDVATPQQVFALDGDSIMLAANRSRVVQVLGGAGADGTPVVVGPRALADWEFWDFRATDGSGADPTVSFVRVASLEELRYHLAEAPVPSGTVIRITDSFNFTLDEPLAVPAGVTIRGDRRGTRFAPVIHMPQDRTGRTIFVIEEPDIRVTNLRFQGPNTERDRSSDREAYQTRALQILTRVDTDYAPDRRIYIDNNDISDFDIQAIMVDGRDEASNDRCDQFGPPPNWAARTLHMRIVRNFLHHNLVQGSGYGVNTRRGGYALIRGNTFVSNRHAIAGTSSTPRTGYRAYGNLVLRHVPVQEWGPFNYLTHDFDMHGTGDDGKGGIAGGLIEVASNTFLGLDDVVLGPHHNFEIRGQSCDAVWIRDNVSLQARNDAISFDGEDLPPFVHIAAQPAQFEHDNPTRGLATGDFDGDGSEDLFLATGTAFYYAPGGAADWRLLAMGRTDPIGTLRFGDFDGDGRTDVIGKNGGTIVVSWGGSAEWQPLNTTAAPIRDLAVGNFLGDERDDILHADGATWRVSSGGGEPFVRTATSALRASHLRFGDFNADGYTDVMGVVGRAWSVSYGASTTWTPLRPALTSSVEHLLVGNFDGHGPDDIATVTLTPYALVWAFSAGGTGDWQPLFVDTTGGLAGVGRFQGAATTDLLFWGAGDNDHLYRGTLTGPERYSRQAMR